MNLNPWLMEQIRILRERHPEAELHERYIHYPDKTWEQHILIWAIQDAMRYSCFNQTLLSMMDLPENVKKGLYSAALIVAQIFCNSPKRNFRLSPGNIGLKPIL